MTHNEIKGQGLQTLDAIDPHGYQMEAGEVILASALKLYLLERQEARDELKVIMGCVIIMPDFKTRTVERQRTIDFPRLLSLTEEAVALSIEMGETDAAKQAEQNVDFSCLAVQILRDTDIKYQLHHTGSGFYDFLADCVNAI